MEHNDSITILRATVDRAAELRKKGQNQSDLMIAEVLVPMLSALGWQKKNGLPTSELAGYVEVKPKPAGILGMVGETPQFLFGPVSNSLPFAGTEEASELMSYSYNKDAPWLILSDLSLITVFNVLESVKVSPARRSPRFSIRFDDLLVSTRELESWLGFEAVKEGNLAELDQKIRRTRGIALPVTDKLFEQMRRWRMELIEEITSRSSLTPNEADILVNRLLNRLLFMRVCEDRGFGEQPNLESITGKSGSSQGNGQLLEQVRSSFRKYHERYDTELFNLSEVDSFSFSEDTLTRIISGLHSPGFPSVKYDFSVIDADILGAMYEQYVRLRAAWQAPATISSDNVQQSFLPALRTTLIAGGKVAGIYYTPKYIVEHIVQQTVGYWFKSKPASIDTAPSVMDMSCGSGSFLLAAYRSMVNHLSVDNSLLTIAEKHWLLTRCIFGVDRDPRAVEIARLNLWLIGLNSRVSLPDLSANILVGNSLLDPAVQADSATLQLFFGADWQQRKPILWKNAFPQQMAAGGFDIIVGNPPYVRIQNMKDQLEKKFYAEYFGAATGGFDLSVAFVEMALKLLKPGGVVGLIVSNALLRSNYAEHLRRRLTQDGVVKHVVDFTDQLVFRGIGAYTCLMFLQKPGPSSPKATSIFSLKSIPALQLRRSEENEVYDKQMVSGSVENRRLGGGPWVLVPDREQRLREKLAEGRPKLEELVRIFQGIKTGRDKAFILHVTRSIPEQGLVMAHSELTNKDHPFELALMKPLIKGRHMRRFHLIPSDLMMLFPYKEGQLIAEDTLCEKYEHAWKYLEQVKGNLSSRPKVTKGGWGTRWYAFSYPKNLLLFPKPKLITPDIAAEASFAYDEDGGLHFSGGVAGGYGLAMESDKVTPQFLTGLLNSSLLDWYFKPGAARFQEGYFLYESRFLRNQPIETYYDDKDSPKEIAVEIVSIVRQIMEAKKNLHAEGDSVSLARMVDHTHELERELDTLVFALYRLTQDEIRLVKEGPWYKG